MAYSGSNSFSTDSSGSINGGFSSGASQGSTYDEFGTGVVGDTIANQIAVGGFGAGSMGEGDSFSFSPQRAQDQIQADVNRQLQALAQARSNAGQQMVTQGVLNQNYQLYNAQNNADIANIAQQIYRGDNPTGLLSKIPSVFTAIGGAIGSMNRNRMQEAIRMGGKAHYRGDTKFISHVTDPYGNVIAGTDPFAETTEGGDQPDRPRYPYPYPYPYPVTAEEEAEEEYQSSIPTEYVRPEGGFYPEAGAYARLGLLDTLPDNLLGYMPNFAEQNRAFRMAGATRPELYQDPYNLQGYSLLS